MKYKELGDTGVCISKICLGSMTWINGGAPRIRIDFRDPTEASRLKTITLSKDLQDLWTIFSP
jgi:aryl-alcohol dehydrogenase-like predicted oxidoreductase